MPVTSAAAECFGGGSAVMADGWPVFRLNLSVLSLIIIRLECLRTLEYDIQSSDASIFVLNGN